MIMTREKTNPKYTFNSITGDQLAQRICVVAVHELNEQNGLRDHKYSETFYEEYRTHNPDDGIEYHINLQDQKGITMKVLLETPGPKGGMVGRGIYRPENYAYLQWLLPLL